MKNFDWYKYFCEKYQEDPLNIKISNDTVIIPIGDIHEHYFLFKKLMKKLLKIDNAIIVSLGDLYDKGEGTEAGNSIFHELESLMDQRKAYLVKGNHEAKKIRKKDFSTPYQKLETLPNVVSFIYPSGFRLTCLHGGIKPNDSMNDLKYSEQILYIRTIDEAGKMIKLIRVKNENGEVEFIPEKPNGVIWHQKYDNRFGYIASGHDPQKDGLAKFYNYSCNLDSAVFKTKILTSAVFNKNGFQEVIKVSNE